MSIPKIDLFSNPHKEQRLLFCALSTNIAKLDVNDAAAMSSLQKDIDTLLEELHEHGLSEDTFIGPLLKEFSKSLEEAHETIDRLMLEVAASLKELFDAKPEERADKAASLYRTFNRFMGHYFLHLDMEETQIMPFLWQHFTLEEIIGVIFAFKTYNQPEEAEEMLPSILKAMTNEEKELMLISIKKHAFQEAYEASLKFASKYSI